MQRMLGQEHGGMNEVLADIYAITGDEKYLRLARRFCHQAVLDPLMRHEDRLTGLHANTQIPKVVGLERIATLTGDQEADSGARFFWENVTGKRTVAFGGNSVSEHFNDPKNFRGMLEHREGPETCNTYNMLRLTEQLFLASPRRPTPITTSARSTITSSRPSTPSGPGYVYFTPIRPQHYRVYSQPDKGFWCCVGTGMENPGKYGEFIYARASRRPLRQSLHRLRNHRAESRPDAAAGNHFPRRAAHTLTLKLKRPTTFTLRLRHPGWVAAGEFAVRVNGKPSPSPRRRHPTPHFAANGRTAIASKSNFRCAPRLSACPTVPTGSPFCAAPSCWPRPPGTNDLVGLRADDSRMGHVARGPMVPLDRVPVLLATAGDLPRHVHPDPAGGRCTSGSLTSSSRHRQKDCRSSRSSGCTTPLPDVLATHDQGGTCGKAGTPAPPQERIKQAREAATLDSVAVGEQQPEVEHSFGERTPNQASFRAAAGATAAGFNTHSTCMGRVPPSLLSPTPAGIVIETSTSLPTTPCWRPNASMERNRVSFSSDATRFRLV